MGCPKLHIIEQNQGPTTPPSNPLKPNSQTPQNHLTACNPYHQTFTGSYRFAFNGMEQDNELKGNGNSLDFGARIYDPRLGRFLSVDTKTAKYPFLSPYAFASNNPIRFSENGFETTDVIEKRVKNTGNLIIYITNGVDNHDYKLSKTNDNWDVLYVHSINDAANYIQKNNMKDINNLVIANHGNDREDSPSLAHNSSANHLSAAYIGTESKADKEALKSLETIGDHLSSNAKVLITACGAGSKSNFGTYIYKAFDNEGITLYMPNDKTHPMRVSWKMETEIIEYEFYDIKKDKWITKKKKVEYKGDVNYEYFPLDTKLIKDKDKIGNVTGFSVFDKSGSCQQSVSNIEVTSNGSIKTKK